MLKTGVAVTIVGGLAFIVGTGMLFAGTGGINVFNRSSALYAPPKQNETLEAAGGIAMLAGLGAMGIGIPLMVVGHRRESIPAATLRVAPLPVAGGGGAMVDLRF